LPIPTSVKGLVLLSGPRDTYVNSLKSAKKLKAMAPHFKQIIYTEALHEIDNEVESIQIDVQKQILEFLKTLGTDI
jgi:hypothetical protein